MNDNESNGEALPKKLNPPYTIPFNAAGIRIHIREFVQTIKFHPDSKGKGRHALQLIRGVIRNRKIESVEICDDRVVFFTLRKPIDQWVLKFLSEMIHARFSYTWEHGGVEHMELWSERGEQFFEDTCDKRPLRELLPVD